MLQIQTRSAVFPKPASSVKTPAATQVQNLSITSLLKLTIYTNLSCLYLACALGKNTKQQLD